MSLKPRTVADPSVDISKRFAEGQKYLEGVNLVQEADLSRAAAVPTYQPIPLELATLFGEDKTHTPFAYFTPPAEFSKSIFRVFLMPSIGDTDAIKFLKEKIAAAPITPGAAAIPPEGEEAPLAEVAPLAEAENPLPPEALTVEQKQQQKLIHVFNQSEVLQALVEYIENKMGQFHKG